jgi:hypothetical protein
MYIVISKPKRRSSKAGCVHCMGCLLVGGTPPVGGRRVRVRRTRAPLRKSRAARLEPALTARFRGFTRAAAAPVRATVPAGASRPRGVFHVGTAADAARHRVHPWLLRRTSLRSCADASGPVFPRGAKRRRGNPLPWPATRPAAVDPATSRRMTSLVRSLGASAACGRRRGSRDFAQDGIARAAPAQLAADGVLPATSRRRASRAQRQRSLR